MEVLIINGLRHTPHPSHFSIAEATEVARQVSPKQTYFTHCCHEIGLYAEVEPTLPEGMHLAYDGLTIRL